MTTVKKEYLVRGEGMALKERLLQLYKNKEISENSYQRYIKLIEIIQTNDWGVRVNE
jgi:hypothetical protein